MKSNLIAKEIFSELVSAHDEGEEDLVSETHARLVSIAGPLSVKTTAKTYWEESAIEGFSEFPLVVQTCRLYAGKQLVHTGTRSFGTEYVDVTHTGYGGEWEAIFLDSEDFPEDLLNEIGIDVDWPDVPPPRKAKRRK